MNSNNNKKRKFFSIRIYGILDKKNEKILKVSLNKEEIKFELDLDNYDDNFILCDFDLKIEIPF